MQEFIRIEIPSNLFYHHKKTRTQGNVEKHGASPGGCHKYNTLRILYMNIHK